MNKRQAQELAHTIGLKSRAWMDDDMYGAFLRGDIFGTSPQQISVIPAKDGNGFAVHAHWEYLDETFHSVDEWEAFAARIEERIGPAALFSPGEAERREGLNL